MIKILRLELVPGADEAAFLEADKQVQAEYSYQQPGLLRRTTARGDDGRWVVIGLWRSAEAAAAADEAWGQDPVTAAYMRFVAPDSVTVEGYVEVG